MSDGGRKRLVVLGSTGSVGEQTLAVAAEFPDDYRVVGLAAGRNVAKLAEQIRRHRRTPGCRRQAEVQIGRPSRDPAARCAHQEALLNQERFEYILYGTPLLSDRRGQGLDSHRPAVKSLDDCKQ